MNDPHPYDRLLDGHSKTIADLQKRVIAVEMQVEAQKEALRRFVNDMATEWRQQLITLAHELRDDSDFARPWWESGIGHVADHLATDRGQKAIKSHGFTSLAEWWVRVQMKLVRDTVANWVLAVVLGACGLVILWQIVKSGALVKVLGG